ncbi:MAG: TlpA disulfide reductase family protein [Bacteroidota bacterium]|nr:TlpA disulfide reductase family protein [Bacteroidota bacterium]MEC8030461.1 TlpA disulfide reductase family protein [Bacteroidota bacterium]MEC8459552.1 TlpA disulfide reductase family protein [Bacteroidota bacterium]MEC8605848.1 TlpA disulfide reductase family protein [Bacteroidota bacterium]
MNRITFFLLLLVFPLTFVPQNEENRGYRVKVGDPVPPLTLQMINGEIWTNKDFIDKTVVIQFTGSWCSVCKKEMPELESRVWQNYKEKDFLLIGIDIKDTRDRMISFIEKTGVTYPIAWDPEAEIFDLFTLKGAGVTRNIVINKRGEIVFLTRLFEEKEFQAMIDKIDELVNL